MIVRFVSDFIRFRYLCDVRDSCDVCDLCDVCDFCDLVNQIPLMRFFFLWIYDFWMSRNHKNLKK